MSDWEICDEAQTLGFVISLEISAIKVLDSRDGL